MTSRLWLSRNFSPKQISILLFETSAREYRPTSSPWLKNNITTEDILKQFNHLGTVTFATKLSKILSKRQEHIHKQTQHRTDRREELTGSCLPPCYPFRCCWFTYWPMYHSATSPLLTRRGKLGSCPSSANLELIKVLSATSSLQRGMYVGSRCRCSDVIWNGAVNWSALGLLIGDLRFGQSAVRVDGSDTNVTGLKSHGLSYEMIWFAEAMQCKRALPLAT